MTQWVKFGTQAMSAQDPDYPKRTSLLNHLIGAREQGRWNFEAELPRRSEVNCQVEFRRALDRQVGRFGTL
jgi:hypothetical protein